MALSELVGDLLRREVLLDELAVPVQTGADGAILLFAAALA
jgi:hypothetical protein